MGISPLQTAVLADGPFLLILPSLPKLAGAFQQSAVPASALFPSQTSEAKAGSQQR